MPAAQAEIARLKASQPYLRNVATAPRTEIGPE